MNSCLPEAAEKSPHLEILRRIDEQRDPNNPRRHITNEINQIACSTGGTARHAESRTFGTLARKAEVGDAA